jgi:histone H4
MPGKPKLQKEDSDSESSEDEAPTPKPKKAEKVKKTESKKTEKKHRKILRDNIQGITKKALLRILRTSGVKRVNSGCFEVGRTLIVEYITPILKTAIICTEHGRRKTVSSSRYC